MVQIETEKDPVFKWPKWPNKRKPRKQRPNNLPKYTYGLEGKLEGLIGEPIVLAQRAVRSKFETLISVNEGLSVRHTYTTQRDFQYITDDREMLPWDKLANTTMFHMTMPPVTHRAYNFRVDLWEDSEGKFSKFSFALQVSS